MSSTLIEERAFVPSQYCTLVNSLDNNPDPHFKAQYKRWNFWHDAIYVVEWSVHRKSISRSSGRSTVCVICFNAVPTECFNMVMHSRDKAETCTRTSVAVPYSPPSRKANDAPLKGHKSISHAVVLGKGTLQEETLSVTQTQETKWDHTADPSNTASSKERHFRKDEETDSSRFQSSRCGEEKPLGVGRCV